MFLPLTNGVSPKLYISNKSMPKLHTSDFVENSWLTSASIDNHLIGKRPEPETNDLLEFVEA